METVQQPRQPNIQDKKGQHNAGHFHNAEGKGLSKHYRMDERFEALIQSQCASATVDTIAALQVIGRRSQRGWTLTTD